MRFYRVISLLVLVISFLVVGINVNASENLDEAVELIAAGLSLSKEAKVVHISKDEIYLNIGQQDGVQVGDLFEIVSLGDPISVGNEIIGHKEVPVAKAKADKVRKKMTICKIIAMVGQPKQGNKAYQMRKRVDRITVSQFGYNQTTNQLTQSIQRKLQTRLIQKGVRVIERNQLEKVLKEQKLSYSGLLDIGSAKKVGALLGAGAIVLGSVGDMGNVISIDARLVDLETGDTMTAAETDLPKTPLVKALLDKETKEALGTNGVSGKPNKSKSEVQQTVATSSFKFILNGCTLENGNAICRLLVQSLEQDRQAKFCAACWGYMAPISKLYDDNGIEFLADSISVGAKKSKNEVETFLVAGVPTPMKLHFNGVSPEVKTITLLKLLYRYDGSWWEAQFRNISFQKNK